VGVTARPFLLKPNVAEAEELTGRLLPTLAEQVEAVRALQELGIQLVALTRAQEGALLADATGMLSVTPPLVATGSPIGAGDAFLAGLIYAWSQGASLADMARWAAACGAAAASQEGTGVGQRADVEALLPQARIEIIEGAQPTSCWSDRIRLYSLSDYITPTSCWSDIIRQAV